MNARAMNMARMGSALGLVITMAGCASNSAPMVDARFGSATRALREQQTIDLDAGSRRAGKPESGVGRYIKPSSDRLTESFRNPTATDVQSGGVGVTGAGR